MERTRTIGRILGLAIALLLCPYWIGSPAVAADQPKRGGAITVGNDEDAVGLDPHLAFAWASQNFYEHVYNGLLRFNAKMEIEGDLAASWEMPDDRTYVFHLRKGVKFHNGRELISEDVKYSIERIMDPKTGSPFKSLYDGVASIETPDRSTIKIVLKAPNAPFLAHLANIRGGAIVPQEEVERHGTLQKVAIGTGPFKLVEYIPGERAQYVRNKEYFEPNLPYLDGFTIKVIKDEASRLAAIRQGAVDLTWLKSIPIEMAARQDKSLVAAETAPARHLYVWLNHKIPPFENRKVRQAVSLAMNRQEVIDTVLFGQGVLTAAIPPAAVPYALTPAEVARLPFYQQNFNEARKLLAEAGYPNGFEFVVKTSPHSPDYVPAAQVIQRQLAKIGIKMNIRQMEWGILLKDFRANDFQALIFANIWYPDPEGWVYPFTHSDSPQNVGGYGNPEVDRLLEQQRVTTDVRKRVALWRTLQKVYAEDIPIYWIYAMRSRFEVWQPRVKGYKSLANTSRVYLRETWIDE